MLQLKKYFKNVPFLTTFPSCPLIFRGSLYLILTSLLGPPCPVLNSRSFSGCSNYPCSLTLGNSCPSRQAMAKDQPSGLSSAFAPGVLVSAT